MDSNFASCSSPSIQCAGAANNDSGGGGGGSCTEEAGDGEDEDSSSSSSSSTPLFDSDDEDRPRRESINETLARFRAEWQAELRNDDLCKNKSQQAVSSDSTSSESKEQVARRLFRLGMKNEETGDLYTAVMFYKRAMQLVPDIEFKLSSERPRKQSRRRRSNSGSSLDSGGNVSNGAGTSSGVVLGDLTEEELDLENCRTLTERFARIQLLDGDLRYCQPENDASECHMAKLPAEIMLHIFKWVVGAELDLRSLDTIGLVCRGWYRLARDGELWRLICYKLFGASTEEPEGQGYPDWREMAIHRPHVHFNGCYISKATYIRHGEPAVGSVYQAFHIVSYYRVLRFHANGRCFLMNSPEEPETLVKVLAAAHPRPVQGLMDGIYRVSPSGLLTAVLRRRLTKEEKSAASATTIRSRYRRAPPPPSSHVPTETSFHLEMQLDTCKRSGLPHGVLRWLKYDCHQRYESTGEDTVAELEVNDRHFPKMVFSRVKSYMQESNRSLEQD